jgi:hypothetical protein
MTLNDGQSFRNAPGTAARMETFNGPIARTREAL